MAALDAIDAEGLQRRLGGGPPLLLTFVKPNCAYCDRIAPELAALADDWGDRAAFAQLDLADAPSLIETYGIRGTPTVLLFGADGRELGRKAGFQRRQQLEAFLRHHLGDTA